jgi:hypothetical protein
MKQDDLLNIELKKGEHLANKLVEHLNRMSAEKAIIPAELNGKKYLVEIKPKE